MEHFVFPKFPLQFAAFYSGVVRPSLIDPLSSIVLAVADDNNGDARYLSAGSTQYAARDCTENKRKLVPRASAAAKCVFELGEKLKQNLR